MNIHIINFIVPECYVILNKLEKETIMRAQYGIKNCHVKLDRYEVELFKKSMSNRTMKGMKTQQN